RHQARHGVRRPRAAAPARRPGAAAAGALPCRAPAGRGPGRFLLPHRQRRVTKRRRRGGRAVTHFYPAFLDLRGRRAVVVGGGAIAEQKVGGLLDAGARVTVISPSVARRLDDLEAAGAGAIGRLIGPEYATLLELLGELRAELARRVRDVSVRTRLWYRIVDSDAIESVRRGDVAGARRRIDQLVGAATGKRAGHPAPDGIVYL